MWRRFIVVFVISLFAINLMAKGFIVRDSIQYAFLVDSLSAIQYPGTKHERKDKFFDKMDSLVLCREGKISILHIGGSHVQADIFSHTVRCLMDSVNDGFKPSRGLLFPYKVAKTNNPSNYKVYSKGTWETSKNVKKDRVATLGMTGIAVTSNDLDAEISLKMVNDSLQRWTFTRLRLLGYSDTLCVPVIVESDTSLIFPVHDDATQSYLYEFPEARDTFMLRFIQRDSVPHNFTVCGFILENDEDGVVYHSIGVNGAAVPSYLSCPNFERDMNLIRPDMVVFGIGINDAVPVNFSEEKFIANYDSLISMIDRVNPDCFYVFVTNNDSFRKYRSKKRSIYEVNTNGTKVEHAFYTLAEKHQGGYWNLFGWMGGLKSMRTWEMNGLAQKDKIHFTKKGYKLIGNAFYNALISSYLDKE